MLQVEYYKRKVEVMRGVLKGRDDQIQRLREEINKRAREIILPYTYKKRFNGIVNENMNGSNYPRARTSARQEVTIGNVLDYLGR